jgi:hypothetical protein
MITVRELIEYLKTQPQDIPVAYYCFSERLLLRLDDISLGVGCIPRPDGWVQNSRPDMPSQPYLCFPGN